MVTLPWLVAKVPAVAVMLEPSLSTAPLSTLPVLATSSLVLTVGLVTVRSLTWATLMVTVPLVLSSSAVAVKPKLSRSGERRVGEEGGVRSAGMLSVERGGEVGVGGGGGI